MKMFQCCGQRLKASTKNNESNDADIERVAYNKRVSVMRTSEYPMLQGITYLDHGGTTLVPRSLLKSFCHEMQAVLLANPHSDATNPSPSAVMIEQTRLKVLKMFNADPEYFDIVFTANATAAIKLVTEGFSGHDEGFDYYYHRNSHTSLVGVRELANRSHCLASNGAVEDWLAGKSAFDEELASQRSTLFAYPAQSNMNGERLPLDWSRSLRFSLHHPNTYTLLDAAALVSTTPLDLSNHLFAPDFVALSFYKIFGFPDLGALIVRKAAGHVFDKRKYFGGGTTEMTTCIGDTWVIRKQSSLHARLEDGTIAIRSILALKCAIETHGKLFGGLGQVSKHTTWLAKVLYERLMRLKHFNGAPVCQSYTAPSSTYSDPKTQGATIAFNICKSDKSFMGPWHVGAMLRANGIHVRTGTVCNPAGITCALGIKTDWLRGAFDEGWRCNTDADVMAGIPIGIVRVTFGAMSTMEDVEALVRSLSRNVVEHEAAIDAKASSYVKRKDSAIGFKERVEIGETLKVQEKTEKNKRITAETTLKTPRWWRRWKMKMRGCFH